ncbi:hypothetical protein QJS10_CPB18g01868 [Acorus calamus]|uniref:Uncharacterized protein n=1 Tax=Acorus calamus TaxID=4465 RepID=A0AAV9CPZ8_ACOCL|nr:hypothetical protein QJS10_CPB18g01868 [Acorus calamus]
MEEISNPHLIQCFEQTTPTKTKTVNSQPLKVELKPDPWRLRPPAGDAFTHRYEEGRIC